MIPKDRIKYIKLGNELGIEVRRADIFNNKSFVTKSVQYDEEDIESTFIAAELNYKA